MLFEHDHRLGGLYQKFLREIRRDLQRLYRRRLLSWLEWTFQTGSVLEVLYELLSA